MCSKIVLAYCLLMLLFLSSCGSAGPIITSSSCNQYQYITFVPSYDAFQVEGAQFSINKRLWSTSWKDKTLRICPILYKEIFDAREMTVESFTITTYYTFWDFLLNLIPFLSPKSVEISGRL